MLVLNKNLRQSIKTNKLIINITNEEYKQINSLIDKLKNKYHQEIKNITKNKEKFDKIEAHNLLVKDIIKEIIDNFEIIKKYNVCIFLTGSYARYTNKLNSDLDLHFCYKNKYRNILFKYEEIIYYIFVSIFDLDRGKVHNMILSRIDKNNNNKINNILDHNDLEIILACDTKNIIYKLKGNIKSRIYLQYGNNKDLKNIYNYLKNEILSYNREWAHVFYVFTNEKEFSKYYNKLLQIEMKHNSIEKINTRKENIQKKIEYINQQINKAQKESICDFKNIFQMEAFKLFYEYLSYKRDLYLLSNQEWKFINLKDNREYLTYDPIIDNIENYIYNLFEIVEPLKNKYSIHKDGYIDSKYFNQLTKELFIITQMIGGYLWKE